MNVSIVDACFPLEDGAKGLAAEWLAWYVAKLGSSVVPLGSSDTVLLSCVDPRNWKVAKRIRKRYPQAKIVAGGAGALAPYCIGLWADCVCVGDGQRFVQTLISGGFDAARKLPEAWVNGESKSVEVAQGFPWDCPPIVADDGKYRVWCGRGCKKKCAYCQTAWSTVYEENPNPKELIRQINYLSSKGKGFAYLSNDVAQHSFYSQLPATSNGSFTLDFIKRNGLPGARQLRLGIEGVSERLRAMVGKPISHEDLVKSAAWLNANKKSIRWFMIAGLPGETDADWEELKRAITDWKRMSAKGVLALSFTAWQPEPATPLGIFPLDDGYEHRFTDFKDWFFDGPGWSNRIKIMNPAMPKTRMESAMARMGLSEADLRVGGSWGPNDRVNYPYKSARNKAANRIIECLTPTA